MKKITTTSLPVVLFAALCAFSQLASAQGAQTGRANEQRGKDIFVRYGCYSCHGYAAHGGPGGRLAPMRMTLANFTSYVRNPARMPPYSPKVMSDAQLADIWSYLKSIPESLPAGSISLLKPN
ncbi:MAG: cytochrome c [Acidobacteria bacterium]|nr:cytochrome c [Acidobacteriota bacterium]